MSMRLDCIYDKKESNAVKYNNKFMFDSWSMDTSEWDEPEDSGVIEVPVDSETVIYQDDTGQYYEIEIDELIEYDDDKEITYFSKDEDKKEDAKSINVINNSFLFDRNVKNNLYKNHFFHIR